MQSVSFSACWLCPWNDSPYGHKMAAEVPASLPDPATWREEQGHGFMNIFLQVPSMFQREDSSKFSFYLISCDCALCPGLKQN